MYYIVKIVLEKYIINYMNLGIAFLLAVVIGLLIIVYGVFRKYKMKNYNI